MISLSLLLHLHQPPTQFPEVLRLVFQQSYQPLLKLLSKSREARVTLNITASLLEQLDELGMSGWLEGLAALVAEGRVELTGTAAYHPLLPKIPEEEARRQILLNERELRRTTAPHDHKTTTRHGFFPPEMAVDERTVRLVGEMGYSWVAVDETAVSGRLNLPKNGLFAWKGSTFKKKDLTLKLAVRNKELSLRIAFGQIRNLKDFLLYANNHEPITNNLIVALDGETFGHHHPELLPFLGDLLANSGKGGYRLVTVSELISENLPAEALPCRQAGLAKAGPPTASVKIRPSTWADGFARWHDPDNIIHRKQWQLTELAIKAVNESKSKIYNLESKIENQKNYRFDILDFRSGRGLEGLTSSQKQWWKARRLLDRALHSDQYWWASARPNWHYKMVERGAKMLRDVVLAVPDAPRRCPLNALRLYNEITRLGLEKYGDTIIV